MKKQPLSARIRGWWRVHVTRPLGKHQVAVLMGAWLVSFTLGVWGYWLMSAERGTETSLAQIVYQSLHLFTFKGGEKFAHGPWPLEIARWSSPGVAAYTAAKGLIAVFYDQIQRLRALLTRNHVVVCGLSDKGRLIADAFLAQNMRVVVIERDTSRAKLAGARAEGAIVLTGEADEPAVLEIAGIRRARYLVAACDDDTNARIVHLAATACESSRRALDCLAHISDGPLQRRLWDFAASMNRRGHFSVRFFNLEESAARTLFTEHPPFSLDPEDGKELPSILIAADDELLDHALDALAQRWMVREVHSDRRLALMPHSATVQAGIEAARRRCPILWERIDIAPLDPAAADIAYLIQSATVDAVCVGFDLLKTLGPTATLVIRGKQNSGLTHMLNDERVRVFSVYEDTCESPDLLLGVQTEALAKLIHEYYLRDHPDYASWTELPEGLRTSNRDQAEWIFRVLADAGLTVEVALRRVDDPLQLTKLEVEGLAEAEHRRWSVEKLVAGWRPAPAGQAEQNEVAKTHPFLVPWQQLESDEIREIDRRFVREWSIMLAQPGVGHVVVRPTADHESPA